MKRRRTLRRLAPDAELFRRRASGESLRAIACDYKVAHTTLGRFFVRREAKDRLKEARQQLRADRQVLVARRLVERRLERQVRREAKEQDKAEREQEARYQAALAEWRSRRRPPRSDYEAHLDRHDVPQPPPTRADRHRTHDLIAAGVIAQGGGIGQLMAETGLRPLENVVNLIDPVIVTQAFDNDLLAHRQPPPPSVAVRRSPRLRRLVPNADLIRRRASGEPLRALAGDYDVAHTTLGRFFCRPEIESQLSQTVQHLRAEQRALRRAAKRRN